jgi:menaquinone-dependent protoporphyrinogen IX oxidase
MWMFRRVFCKLGATGLVSMAISKRIQALEKAVSAPAKKWAIVYGSGCGTTKKYADAINEGLGGIADVINIETTTPKADDYEFFIIGGWRNASKVLPDKIPNFIKNNKSALQNKIKGLFLVLGNNGVVEITPDMKTFLKSSLITPAGANENVGKIFFGDYPTCSMNPSPNPYKNFNKDDGIAFGEKILSENKTGISGTFLGIGRVLDLSYSRGISGRSAAINYSLPSAGYVELTICSIHGQKVATLVTKYQNAGAYRIPLSGKHLTSGQYICRLETEGLVKIVTATITQQ